jgi:hypothetical protein
VKTTVEPVDEGESAKLCTNLKKAKAERKQVNENQIFYKVILFLDTTLIIGQESRQGKGKCRDQKPNFDGHQPSA